MSLIDILKAFFESPEVDPIAIAARRTFSVAGETYDAASHATEPYTNRANHRHAILRATHALHKAPLDDAHAAAAYDEVVAMYTEPADFAPYTEEYLEAHTAVMESLSAAFDNLNTAFAAFELGDDLNAQAAAYYRATCRAYTFASNAYSVAVFCAMTAALEGQLQATKDEWRASLLQDRAENAAPIDAVTAKAEAAAAKAKAYADGTNANALEARANAAQTKAEVFLTKAKTAEARAEEAVQYNTADGA